jgi:hypothetical protein
MRCCKINFYKFKKKKTTKRYSYRKRSCSFLSSNEKIPSEKKQTKKNKLLGYSRKIWNRCNKIVNGIEKERKGGRNYK